MVVEPVVEPLRLPQLAASFFKLANHQVTQRLSLHFDFQLSGPPPTDP